MLPADTMQVLIKIRCSSVSKMIDEVCSFLSRILFIAFVFIVVAVAKYRAAIKSAPIEKEVLRFESQLRIV